MPWSGGVFTRTNGTYTGTTVWNQDATNAVKIVSTRHDTHDQDLATGINSCMLKDGSNVTAVLGIKRGVSPGTVYNAGANPASIDWNNGFVQYLTFNANYGIPLVLNNPTAGVQYTLFVNNTDSSNHTISLASGIGGVAGLTVNANTISQITIMKMGNLTSTLVVNSGITSTSFAGP